MTPRLPSPAILRRYAESPMGFFEDVKFRGKHFGASMAPFQREWLQAVSPSLLAVARGDDPPCGRFALNACKGAGKDGLMSLMSDWLLMFTRRPLECQIGACDQDNADELSKANKAWFAENPWFAARLEQQNYRLICKSTDAELEVLSSDTSGGHGSRPDFLIVNEMTHIPKGKWECAETWLDNASKVSGNLVILAYNAGWLGTPAHRWHEMARTSPRWKLFRVAGPLPWKSAEQDAEDQQRNSATRYARLVKNEFQTGTGDALEEADLLASVDPTIGPMLGNEPDFGFVAGLDIGIKRDHTGLAVVGRDFKAEREAGPSFHDPAEGGYRPTRRYRLAAAMAWEPGGNGGQVDISSVKQTVLEWNRRYKLQAVAFDPNQCLGLAQDLRKSGVNMVEVPFSPKSHTAMATILLDVFRSRSFRMFDCHRLLSDLRKLSIVETASGYRLDAARGKDGHADVAYAFCLALLRAQNVQPPVSNWGGIINDSGSGMRAPWNASSRAEPYRPGARVSIGPHLNQ